jgi:deazaflavin-dependent oxidoreductase (nitroreductase family)
VDVDQEALARYPLGSTGTRGRLWGCVHRRSSSQTVLPDSQAMERKRRFVTAMQVRLLNPPVRALATRGLLPGVALLETTGRTSGQPRRTPVSDGLERGTDTFWIVAEMGRGAAYVRNIEADPRVRIRVRGRWRTGTAHLLDGEDPRARLRSISRLNAAGVRALGTELLVVRVDLDPSPPR